MNLTRTSLHRQAQSSQRPHPLLIALTVSLLLAIVGKACATTFTVGENGQFESIQTGIVAAAISVGNDEIRVQSGTYFEHLSIAQSQDTLRLSGGWNATFSSFSTNPAATLVSGSQTGTVLTANLDGSAILLVNRLYLTNGRATICGGGANLALTGHGQVAMSDVTINNNEVVGDPQQVGSVQGGGLCARALVDSSLVLTGLNVGGNRATNTMGGVSGGGVYALVDHNARLRIQNCRISANTASTESPDRDATGGGVVLIAGSAASADVRDCTIVNNSVAGTRGKYPGGQVILSADATGSVIIERTRWLQNEDRADGFVEEQLELLNYSGAVLALGNSVVAGSQRGLRLSPRMAMSPLRIVNVTIAGNVSRGLLITDQQPGISIANSIVFGNGINTLDCPVCNLQNNLAGIDPRFVDPTLEVYDYRLRADSPGRDTGTLTPPGGLSSEDLDRSARVFGTSVDIGAYEYSVLFVDGFE